MEGVVTAPSRLDVRDARVLVTGHTGFKGSWLSEWLLLAGARLSGIALDPESPDALFHQLRLSDRMDDARCDVRDVEALAAAVRRADPQIVFHLAAQPLVRRSYREPLTTWHTNVNGTLNLLEAARALDHPVTIIVVTTDKVYRNREWDYAYREEDELGGHDPYSASKAACEIAVASWRASFGARDGVMVATARAGNVVGAGDIAEDRIVPDCFRAWSRGEAVGVRNPGSTRPWQHVLEPLSGYAALAAHVREHGDGIGTCNFGPSDDGARTVDDVVRTLAALAPGREWSGSPGPGAHEARTLSLAIDRARQRLAWRPRLTFAETLAWTDAGYTAPPSELSRLVARQIAEYEARNPGPAMGPAGAP